MAPEEETNEIPVKAAKWDQLITYIVQQLFNQKVILAIVVALGGWNVYQGQTNKETVEHVAMVQDTVKQKQVVAQVWDSAVRKKNDMWKAEMRVYSLMHLHNDSLIMKKLNIKP